MVEALIWWCAADRFCIGPASVPIRRDADQEPARSGTLTGHVKQPDLGLAREIVDLDRLRGRPGDDLASLLLQKGSSLRRQRRVAVLAGSEDQFLAALLEHEPGFV